MKKFLISMIVAMLILVSSVVPAYADTSSGGDGLTAPVVINGTINPIQLTVTHPMLISYTIDPNTGTLTAPDITITNESPIPINVSVLDFSSGPGGDISFQDVGPTAQDWANLNKAASKTYIALGIKIKDATGWNTGYKETTHWSVDSPGLLGTLNPTATGTLILEANHGLAFDKSYTASSCLILQINVA